MNFRIGLALVMMVAMSACQQEGKTGDAGAPQVVAANSRPATASACSAAGGAWRPVCMMQKPACVVTFKDAGKACSGASDCSGRCLAKGSPDMGAKAEGVCAVNNDPCGCFQTVEDGVAQPGICVD